MENFLLYIGKTSVAAGAFYLAYLLHFHKQKHFGFNRIYLPVSLLASFLIPLITFTTVNYVELASRESYSPAISYIPSTPIEYVAPVFEFEWFHYLFGMYILGVAGFLLHLLIGHLKAIHIIRTSNIQKLFNHLVNITKNDIHPFSFFNKIILSEKTLSSPDLEMIVSHEKIHVQEKHTVDILFTEILFLFQWFNPFAWLIKSAVRDNLEYKTDDEIAKTYDPQKYQLAMVALADKKEVAPFLTALNGSQLKNRIMMMKQKTENKFRVARQLIVLPLLAVLVMGLSTREVKTEFTQPTAKVEVIVDGKVIPSDDIDLSKVDFSKGINSMDVINALNIDNVVANGLNMAQAVPTLYIRTSNYVPGTNLDFEENTNTDILIDKNIATEEFYYAIDNNIVSKEKYLKNGKKGFEKVVILSGNSATRKYGEKYKNVVDATSGVPNFFVKDNKEDHSEESISKFLETVEQSDFTYSSSKKYSIADIEISGNKNFDKSILLEMSGLKIGQEIEIPGNEIKSAISNLYDQGPFSDVKISASKIVDDNVWLDISLKEKQTLPNDRIPTEAEWENAANELNRIIRGKITDKDGNPLIQVNVAQKDRPGGRYIVGTVTDNKGVFVIKLEANDEALHISKTGYKSKEINTKEKEEINVVLEVKESRIIRGRIADKDGNPLVQANVVQYNNRGRMINGVVTDNKGAFVFKLEPNVTTLTVSKKGYKSKEVNVEGKEELEIVLEKDSDDMLNKSGQQNFNDFGPESSNEESNTLIIVDGVVKLVSDMLNKSGQQNFNDSGPESSNEESNPLIIVDGVVNILSPKLDFDFSNATIEDYGKLLNIAPENIKSIEVLKDAAAIVAYGEMAKRYSENFRNEAYVITTNRNSAINSILELRQFIAREIVFPTEARDEDNDELNIRFYVRVNNKGEITDIGENIAGDGEIIPIEEVVVTALRPKNVVKEKDIKNGNLLAKEAERVLNKLPDIEIPELKDKILEFWFRFVLEDEEVINADYIYVPQGFSPNGDGVHDVFEVNGLEKKYPNFKMKIINNNGDLMWEYKHNGNPNSTPIWWDGKDKSNEVKKGSYYYAIEFNDGSAKTQSGHFFLAE